MFYPQIYDAVVPTAVTCRYAYCECGAGTSKKANRHTLRCTVCNGITYEDNDSERWD